MNNGFASFDPLSVKYNGNEEVVIQEISRKLMDGPLMKVRFCFKANSGAAPDLRRETILAEWKAEMSKHEQDYPLVLENPNFFDSVKKISITSMPTREQDVIALFNQLIAGGVIRGIKIMSTNGIIVDVFIGIQPFS